MPIPVAPVRVSTVLQQYPAQTSVASQPTYIRPNVAFSQQIPSSNFQQIPVTSVGASITNPTRTVDTGSSDNAYRTTEEKSLSFNQFLSFDQSQPSIYVRDYDKATA